MVWYQSPGFRSYAYRSLVRAKQKKLLYRLTWWTTKPISREKAEKNRDSGRDDQNESDSPFQKENGNVLKRFRKFVEIFIEFTRYRLSVGPRSGSWWGLYNIIRVPSGQLSNAFIEHFNVGFFFWIYFHLNIRYMIGIGCPVVIKYDQLKGQKTDTFQTS